MDFNNLIIRCSSLGKIMGDSRKKDSPLSKTAQSYIESLVKEKVFDYKTEIRSKYLDKGITVENDSIWLYNFVNFRNFEKNEERKTNDFITGECDLYHKDLIVDIKSSWSAETFPATPEEINNKEYEWQLRGYMWLYDVPKAELAYCLVDTPDELLQYETNLSIHKVSHIDPVLRLTSVFFERDKELEQKIIEKVEACREYANEYYNKIINK